VLTSDEAAPQLPVVLELKQNYPNPFNEETAFEYYMTKSGLVTLTIFNLLGDQVEMLVRGNEQSGPHRILWNAGNYPSGFYIYRLSTGQEVKTKKCLHLK